MRVVLVGVVLAVGSAAVAAPIPRAVLQRERVSVEGTVWSGDGVTAPTTYSFETGGVLVYAYNGATHRTGTWKQDGAEVYWETNGRYCEFRGTIRDGVLTGRAWNRPGGSWTLTIKRQPPGTPKP